MALHINFLSKNQYEIKKVEIKVGRQLKPREKSSTGLYGITSYKNNRLLRVSLCHDTANNLVDFKWRFMAECYIDSIT